MLPPTPSPDDPPCPDPSATPPPPPITTKTTTTTPATTAEQGTPPAQNDNANTPAGHKAPAGATPKSAPAAASTGTQGPRRKKPEPTLLGDFLLGRQSPARVAAQRAAQAQVLAKQRRKSVAAPDAAGVREEIRREMRAAAVRRLQQPGGVQARVKAWQKANAAAAKAETSTPKRPAADADSDPAADAAAGAGKDAAADEDRLRTPAAKKSKKRKGPSRQTQSGGEEEASDTTPEAAEGGGHGPAAKEADAAREADAAKLRSNPPPKKRIVSDEHWMKRKKGRNPPVAKPKAEESPSPIPKDFLLRTAQNPSVQAKIKDWAMKVEPAEPPEPPEPPEEAPKARRTVRARRRQTRSEGHLTLDEDGLSTGASSNGSPLKSRSPAADPPRTSLRRIAKPSPFADDGIRVKPLRRKEPADDDVRTRQPKTALPVDDGTRVRPSPGASADEIPARAAQPRRRPAGQDTDRNRASGARRESPIDIIDVIEELEMELDVPSKRRASAKRKPRRKPTPAKVPRMDETSDSLSHGGSSDRGPEHDDSDGISGRPSTLLGGKLADIPFGYSAFSELDLPLGADARNSGKRPPRTQRNSSFKAVPKVFKKVVSEGKNIIQGKPEPPRPAPNQPPSIESWLSNTVDPLLASSGGAKASGAKEKPVDGRSRSSSEAASVQEGRHHGRAGSVPGDDAGREGAEPARAEPGALKRETTSASSSPGLRRSRATRSPAPHSKPGPRRPFREQVKDAFRGESSPHVLPLAVNSSRREDAGPAAHPYGDDWARPEAGARRSPATRRRSPSPDPSSVAESNLGSDPSTIGPPRGGGRPPTSGINELSTILSEEPSSHGPSDVASTVSQSTVTRTTTMTGSSASMSRARGRDPGLKRRLTKHSDLVSVLSLPDGQLLAPSRVRSLRASHAIRKKSAKLDGVTAEDLLQEFADDEHFFQRELKTLVDGVVPVLLTHVLDGDAATTAHGADASRVPAHKAKAMAKAVVNMGVALEELRTSHKLAPLSDIHKLLSWLEGVHPVYNKYLDVWRLGFEDLVVNLAPAIEHLDDGDSLINAMPRNDEGDLLDHDGERVDVAQLLKRPLIRIKWMVKFLKGTHLLLGAGGSDPQPGAEVLLGIFEKLQEKARRRQREERARRVDEDAADTDTTRTRDLRTLAPIKVVMIDPARQVNAKDAFSLDLAHSNGGKIGCRIDLIYRDNLQSPADKGDVLVRETDRSGRSWLLFPPIPKPQISARRDEGERALVAMVRGTHNRREWFELLRLGTDDDEQVADWLAILGSDPMPPAFPSPEPVPSPESVGEEEERAWPASPGPATPAPSHRRSHTVSPVSVRASEDAGASSPERAAEQGPSSRSTHRHSLPSFPLRGQDKSADPGAAAGSAEASRPLPKSKPGHDEGAAPPPPIHRTFSSKSNSPASTSPPDLGLTLPQRLKPLTSSPLKNEYHPSDISSGSSDLSDNSDFRSDSSSSGDGSEDEMEEAGGGGDAGAPDTTQSIAMEEEAEEGEEGEETRCPSVASEESVTPSNSASQAHMMGGRIPAPNDLVKFIASVSLWSNRSSRWKDVAPQASCVAISPGLLEVFQLRTAHGHLPAAVSGSTEAVNGEPSGDGGAQAGREHLLLALDLTPYVRVRMSTAIDVEISQAAIRSHGLRKDIDSTNFRFRAHSKAECRHLFDTACHSSLSGAKFDEMQENISIGALGPHQQQQQQQQQQNQGSEGSLGGDGSAARRTWFGRRNSYRASARAPSVSQASSSGLSASSFLKRLTAGGNLPFDIGRSTVDKQSRPGSAAGTRPASLYTTSGASSGGRTGWTFPRLPSISLGDSNSRNQPLGTAGLKIRLHRQINNHRWADYGNCTLDIMRPRPGPGHELGPYRGRSKRIVVRSTPKKGAAEPLTLLDATLGSGCFNPLGTTGVVVNVWEEPRDARGDASVPACGGISGSVTRWCLQCPNVAQWMWILSLLTQEGSFE